MNDKNKPLVSVGIPLRNSEQHIERLLTEITNQTYGNLEILISDNNSTDETEVRCKEFVKNDKRIRYHKHNKDLTASENFVWLLENASAEYFLWAADDDMREPNYIEALLNQMIGDPACVLAYAPAKTFKSYEEQVYKDTKLQQFPNTSFWANSDFIIQSSRTIIYGLFKRQAMVDYAWFPCMHGNDTAILIYLSTLGTLRMADDTCFYQFRRPQTKESRSQRNFYASAKQFPRLHQLYWYTRAARFGMNKTGRQKPFMVLYLWFAYANLIKRNMKYARKRFVDILRYFRFK